MMTWKIITEEFSARAQLFGGWLQNKIAAIPPGRLKRYFVLFIVLAVSYNSWLILDVLSDGHDGALNRAGFWGKMDAPVIRQPPGVISKKPGSLLNLMDSLSLDSNGKQYLDKLRAERPGLLDSIRQLEYLR